MEQFEMGTPMCLCREGLVPCEQCAYIGPWEPLEKALLRTLRAANPTMKWVHIAQLFNKQNCRFRSADALRCQMSRMHRTSISFRPHLLALADLTRKLHTTPSTIESRWHLEVATIFCKRSGVRAGESKDGFLVGDLFRSSGEGLFVG